MTAAIEHFFVAHPHALLELLRNMFGGPRNVQPLYNGWLIWRGSHCTFCSRDEIDTMMNQKPLVQFNPLKDGVLHGWN